MDREAIAALLYDARRETLRRAALASDATFATSFDASFSPIGWHIGHVAYTEALWVLERLCEDRSLTEQWASRFSQEQSEKARRAELLPGRADILAYADAVRARTLDVLTDADLDANDALRRDGYVFRFLAAHEAQHAETIAYALQIAAEAGHPALFPRLRSSASDVANPRPPERFVEIFPGAALLGTEDANAYDNERPQHSRRIAPFALAERPVDNAAYARFVDAGGYRERAHWSAAGWAWKERAGVTAPRAWQRRGSGWWRIGMAGVELLDPLAPVIGISAHEAEAFAAAAGCRLPTEGEWEAAARSELASPATDLDLAGPSPTAIPCSTPSAPPGLIGLLGGVWEWTSTPFAPYPGFEPFPYPGYSVPYFDRRHRVLRGGSFATRRTIARPTFRNWFEPEARAVFAGLRLVADSQRSRD